MSLKFFILAGLVAMAAAERQSAYDPPYDRDYPVNPRVNPRERFRNYLERADCIQPCGFGCAGMAFKCCKSSSGERSSCIQSTGGWQCKTYDYDKFKPQIDRCQN